MTDSIPPRVLPLANAKKAVSSCYSPRMSWSEMTPISRALSGLFSVAHNALHRRTVGRHLAGYHFLSGYFSGSFYRSTGWLLVYIVYSSVPANKVVDVGLSDSLYSSLRSVSLLSRPIMMPGYLFCPIFPPPKRCCCCCVCFLVLIVSPLHDKAVLFLLRSMLCLPVCLSRRSLIHSAATCFRLLLCCIYSYSRLFLPLWGHTTALRPS